MTNAAISFSYSRVSIENAAIGSSPGIIKNAALGQWKRGYSFLLGCVQNAALSCFYSCVFIRNAAIDVTFGSGKNAAPGQQKRAYSCFWATFKTQLYVTYSCVFIGNAAIDVASGFVKKRGSSMPETQLQTPVWAAFFKTQL